jgi:hypothetical protein
MLGFLELLRTYIVMAGLVPAIHAARRDNTSASSAAAHAHNVRVLEALGGGRRKSGPRKTWIAGTSPAMTPRGPNIACFT